MLCDIENFSPDNLRAISHVNFYAIPFPSLSQQYGNNVVQGNVIKIGGVVTIQRGVKTISLSTSEQDFEVEFPESFSDTPSVVFSIERFGYASATFAVLKSRTAQKFTITAASGQNANLAVSIVWVAISPSN